MKSDIAYFVRDDDLVTFEDEVDIEPEAGLRSEYSHIELAPQE